MRQSAYAFVGSETLSMSNPVGADQRCGIPLLSALDHVSAHSAILLRIVSQTFNNLDLIHVYRAEEHFVNWHWPGSVKSWW